ncbi:MAG: hypothetical protein J6T10_22565 [Methanobrevibacter sp.]|nr:hypothetical protein [Methanobrevibacter sp.]
MKKMEYVNAIINNGGIENENGTYDMTKKTYDNFLFDVDGVKIIENENQRIAKFGGKSVIINLISKKNMKKSPSGGNGVKSKNSGYIVLLRNKGESKEKTITSLTTCAEIKGFIKELDKKNVEYLKIYDSMQNVCRKSAWIERE